MDQNCVDMVLKDIDKEFKTKSVKAMRDEEITSEEIAERMRKAKAERKELIKIRK